MDNEVRFSFVVESNGEKDNDICLSALNQLIDSLNEGVVVADLYRFGKLISTTVLGCQPVIDAHKKGELSPNEVEFRQLHQKIA